MMGPSTPRAEMVWTRRNGRHDLRHLEPSWCLQLLPPPTVFISGSEPGMSTACVDCLILKDVIGLLLLIENSYCTATHQWFTQALGRDECAHEAEVRVRAC